MRNVYDDDDYDYLLALYIAFWEEDGRSVI